MSAPPGDFILTARRSSFDRGARLIIKKRILPTGVSWGSNVDARDWISIEVKAMFPKQIISVGQSLGSGQFRNG
jgi:hypothetical protein